VVDTLLPFQLHLSPIVFVHTVGKLELVN
jgi:hypothetical protein